MRTKSHSLWTTSALLLLLTSDLTRGGNCNNTEDGGEEHKVHLASFLYCEFGSILFFTLLLLVASLCKILFHHAPQFIHYLPESCVLIIVGVITGLFVHFVAPDFVDEAFPKFDNKIFFNVLLPPIILDAAYGLYDEDFFMNLSPILTFAVVGTILNVFVVGGLLYGAYFLGLMWDLPIELTFIQVSTVKSRFNESRFNVKSRFKELNLVTKMEFLIKKSRFSVKSQFKESKCADGGHSLNRDFTVRVDIVVKERHPYLQLFPCKTTFKYSRPRLIYPRIIGPLL